MQISRRGLLGGSAAPGAAVPLPGFADEAYAAQARGNLSAEVVVVGAGLAGLTAARDLPAADPTTGDVRGQARVAALAEELGLSRFPTYDKGAYFDYRCDLPNQRQTYSGRIPTHDPSATVEAGKALAQLDAMAKKVSLAALGRPRALAWDLMTFQSWMDHGDTAVGHPYPALPDPWPRPV